MASSRGGKVIYSCKRAIFLIKIMKNEQLYLKGLGDIAAEEAKILNIKAKCCAENKKSVTKKLEKWIMK